jgi:hypothetical protein
MSELPFPLFKDHKSKTRYIWKKRGMIFRDDGHFEFVYNEYIYATNCELCNELFPNSLNRQLDHNHITAEPRNIVCNKCNHHKKDVKKVGNNTNHDYIFKIKNKNYKNGYYFTAKIFRDGKYVLSKSRTTLEKAIIVRDEFIENNSGIYK